MNPSPFATSAPASAPLGPSFRETVVAVDIAAVRSLVADTGFFNASETDVAAELVQERLAKGALSGYEFLFAEDGGRVVGYTCYGHIAGTRASHDLYWIVVERGQQGKGLGKALLRETEARIHALGGRRVYVETSSRALYEPTRAFYRKAGYREEALIEDFYAPGDSKVIYVKVLPE